MRTKKMQIDIDFKATELPPHQRHSRTSRESAAAVAPKFSERMHQLLARFAIQAMTDLEGQRQTGTPGDSYRPMRVTLTKLGYLEDSGKTGLTDSGRKAVIWQITDAGRRIL
jgi:hypothetical protein